MGCIKENMLIDQDALEQDFGECDRLDQRLRDLLSKLERFEANRTIDNETTVVRKETYV